MTKIFEKFQNFQNFVTANRKFKFKLLLNVTNSAQALFMLRHMDGSSIGKCFMNFNKVLFYLLSILAFHSPEWEFK